MKGLVETGSLEGNPEGGSSIPNLEEFAIFFKLQLVQKERSQIDKLIQNWGFIIQMRDLNGIPRSLSVRNLEVDVIIPVELTTTKKAEQTEIQ